MEDTQTPPADPDDVLAELLAKSQKAIAECFVFGSDGNYSLATQFEALNVATRLMRVSIQLAAALDKKPGKEIVQRIKVEHSAPLIDVTPEGEGGP